jgi:excisionase family DNA binding protein
MPTRRTRKIAKESEDQPWLTVADVAGRFQVTERTVRNWIRSGLLVAKKLGGVVRIHPDEVRRLAKPEK